MILDSKRSFPSGGTSCPGLITFRDFLLLLQTDKKVIAQFLQETIRLQSRVYLPHVLLDETFRTNLLNNFWNRDPLESCNNSDHERMSFLELALSYICSRTLPCGHLTTVDTPPLWILFSQPVGVSP